MLIESFLAGFKFATWLTCWCAGAMVAGLLLFLVLLLAISLVGGMSGIILSIVNPAKGVDDKAAQEDDKDE